MRRQAKHPSPISNELCAYLKSSFIPIDNFPENIDGRDRAIREARASLLLEAYCQTERFSHFMQDRLFVSDSMSYFYAQDNESFYIDYTHMSECRWRKCANGNLIIYNGPFKELGLSFYQKYKNQFNLCKNASSCELPERVCRFFDNSGEPFDALSLCNELLRRVDFVRNVPLFNGGGRRDPLMIQDELQKIIGNSFFSLPIPEFCFEHFPATGAQVIPFRNEHGNTFMLVMKILENNNGIKKKMLPATCWVHDWPVDLLIFTVPLPVAKQPLFNLYELTRTDNPTVVLTDSVELAAVNQPQAPAGVIFVSFMCPVDGYHKVDWTPLKKVENIFYLINNHSGSSLMEAAKKAKKLASFLKTQGVNLKFIIAEVDYTALENSMHLLDFRHYLSCGLRGFLKPDSVCCVTNVNRLIAELSKELNTREGGDDGFAL